MSPTPTESGKTPDRSVVERSATGHVAASPAAVWRILSDDFLEISTWAGGVRTSGANPNTPTGFNGSPHGGRVCDVDGLGVTDERVIAFDADQRLLTYSVVADKIPFFVDTMTSTWLVRPGGDESSSRVTLTVKARTKGIIGRIGQIPLGRMLSGAAPGLLGDLTTWAETSEAATSGRQAE